MTNKRLFGVHTLKDEYHHALKRGLDRLQIIDELKRDIKNLAKIDEDLYIYLAVLAHEYGDMALYQGIKIYCHMRELEANKRTKKNIPF